MVATELGRRTALCLDNARRYLREHDSLMALQRSLLPTGPPRNNGVEVAYEYVHGGAGGDWVDVVPLSGARVALVAGSVPGRGMETAAAMGRLRAAVHTLSDLDLEPDEMLARLDDLVRRLADDAGPRRDGNEPPHEAGSEAAHAGSGAWCTFLYLIYDPISLHCCAAGAGRPGLAVVHPDGTAMMLEVPSAAPLGLPGPPFAKTDVTLPEGSVLALHTSGLLEARGGDPEEARLADLLARPSGSVQETACRITEALVPEQAGEDAAVLVARTHVLDPGRVASWDLPMDPAIVSTARSLVTRQLTSWDLDEETFATELIASELVTNAMRHAEAPIRLRLIHDLVLTCEVFDGSSTAPRLRHARTTDEGGRGCSSSPSAPTAGERVTRSTAKPSGPSRSWSTKSGSRPEPSRTGTGCGPAADAASDAPGPAGHGSVEAASALAHGVRAGHRVRRTISLNPLTVIR